MATKLLTIDGTSRSFTANGTKYIIESEISFDRWEKYLLEQPTLSFGCTIPELADAFLNIYNKANENKCADIGVIARDKLTGLKNLTEKKSHSVFRLCALFINTEDEDRGTITEDVISKKINDWKMEGIGVTGFFQLAQHIIPGFMESLQINIPGTSQMPKKKKES